MKGASQLVAVVLNAEMSLYAAVVASHWLEAVAVVVKLSRRAAAAEVAVVVLLVAEVVVVVVEEVAVAVGVGQL